MKSLLRIDASPRLQGSHSRALADYFEAKWRGENEGGDIVQRDLAVNPVPHLSDDLIRGFMENADPEREDMALSLKLISELKAADHVLISSPLYNLSLPSTLKSYIDYVVRADHTFVCEDGGYKGLLSGKEATVIIARGSYETPEFSGDFQSEYLRSILAFVGITVTKIIVFEGTAYSGEERERSLGRCKEAIDCQVRGRGLTLWKGTFTEKDRTELMMLSNGQALAIVSGDAQAYVKLCDDDIQLMLPGKKAISGVAHFLECERAVFAESNFQSFEKHPECIEISGNIAVETGTQEVCVVGKKQEHGYLASQQKYMHVFRRTAMGWRFSRLISNASV